MPAWRESALRFVPPRGYGVSSTEEPTYWAVGRAGRIARIPRVGKAVVDALIADGEGTGRRVRAGAVGGRANRPSGRTGASG